MKSHIAAVAVLLAGCGGTAGGGSSPSPVSAMRPEDRVLLGDFSRVNAVASAFDRVYVAYPTALGIWRPLQRRWEVPRTPPSPRDLELVRAAVIDPLDQSVWLAMDNGWLHYSLESDRWDRGVISGRVSAIATNPADPGRGIWFRTASGWVVQPSIGPSMAAPPPRTLRMAPTIEDAFDDMPQLRALAPSLLLGPRMQQGQFTSAAPATSGSGWYLGTTNRGLLHFDRTAVRPDQLGLGIPGEVVGSVIAVPGGVWVSTDASYDRAASLTFVDADLGTSQTLSGGAAQGLPFDAVRRLLAGDRVIWAATDRGLVRASIDGQRVDRFDEGHGIPDQRMTALTQWRGQVVSGSMGGLSLVDAGNQLVRLDPEFGEPVASLAARGDTLWVGTTRGLFALLRRDAALLMPEGYRILPEGRSTVIGIGYAADTLVALTTERLVWRDPGSGAWSPGPVLSTQLGRLTVLNVTEHGIWVGGQRGAGLVYPSSGVARLLTAPGDLPGEVTAIANDGRFLWVGTPFGLVRLLMSR